MDSRRDKIENFESFFNSAKAIFKELKDSDPCAKPFNDFYNLCICPGGRNGGQDKKIVEVFWGLRLIDVKQRGNTIESEFETGASLVFSRSDRGNVMVILYPAKTDNIQPLEDAIVLYSHLNPAKLSNHKFLKSIWEKFIAYMQYTSLDGTPSCIQKYRVWSMKLCKHLIVDGKYKDTALIKDVRAVVKYILTIGMSGCIIVLIMSKCSTTSENESILKHLESIDTNIERMGNTINDSSKDTLNFK